MCFIPGLFLTLHLYFHLHLYAVYAYVCQIGIFADHALLIPFLFNSISVCIVHLSMEYGPTTIQVRARKSAFNPFIKSHGHYVNWVFLKISVSFYYFLLIKKLPKATGKKNEYTYQLEEGKENSSWSHSPLHRSKGKMTTWI